MEQRISTGYYPPVLVCNSAGLEYGYGSPTNLGNFSKRIAARRVCHPLVLRHNMRDHLRRNIILASCILKYTKQTISSNSGTGSILDVEYSFFWEILHWVRKRLSRLACELSKSFLRIANEESRFLFLVVIFAEAYLASWTSISPKPHIFTPESIAHHKLEVWRFTEAQNWRKHNSRSKLS